jgi:hypothetical protein
VVFSPAVAAGDQDVGAAAGSAEGVRDVDVVAAAAVVVVVVVDPEDVGADDLESAVVVVVVDDDLDVAGSAEGDRDLDAGAAGLAGLAAGPAAVGIVGEAVVSVDVPFFSKINNLYIFLFRSAVV